MKLRQTLELQIISLNANGQGEAFFEGKTIDVDNVFPGDIVKASVTFISKEKIFAKAFEFIKLSDLRIQPLCGHAPKCGGCNWQEISYETQLELKQKLISSEFQKQNLNIVVHPVSPSTSQAYRSKTQFALSFTQGKTLIGHFKKNSHEIVDLDSCPVHPAPINTITQNLKNLIVKNKISIYEEKKHRGLLRHIHLRFSQYEQKSILTLVVNESKTNFTLDQFVKEVAAENKDILGILVNFNTQEGNTIIGNHNELLWGKDLLEEVVNGKHYLFSSTNFFQTNISIAEKICEKIKDLFQGGTLLDLYSGVGLYAVQLGEKATAITCVEYSEAAIVNAKLNLKNNQLDKKSECFSGDVLKFLEHFTSTKKIFDTVIVNPPRKGLDEKVKELLPLIVGRDLIYVSCSPITLARDLKELSSTFIIEELFPFDMFPHTHHVESVVYLKKK